MAKSKYVRRFLVLYADYLTLPPRLTPLRIFHLSIGPVDICCRMLYDYVERDKSRVCEPISVIYMVSGLKDGQDGCQVRFSALFDYVNCELIRSNFSIRNLSLIRNTRAPLT